MLASARLPRCLLVVAAIDKAIPTLMPISTPPDVPYPLLYAQIFATDEENEGESQVFVISSRSLLREET